MFLLLIIVFLLIVYLSINFYLHQPFLPNLQCSKYKSKSAKCKVLFIFPHPDDETMISGSLIYQLCKNPGFKVKVISTTKGEAGDELLKLDKSELGKIRKNEFEHAMNILGVNDFEMWNFRDGELRQNYESLLEKTRIEINEAQYDLIITYEKWGLYGHPDHMALSKIISHLKEELNLNVLYATLSKTILKFYKLPIHMADDPSKLRQTQPEFKVSSINSLLAKYRAAKVYKSQNLGQGKPLWLVMLFSIFEYYSEKYPA